MSYLEEYRRLTGEAPSLLEREANVGRSMLDVLAKAFSTDVKPADVKYIRYRRFRTGVELEDVGDRLGDILTSVEAKEADPKDLVAFLKKHGAKPSKAKAEP